MTNTYLPFSGDEPTCSKCGNSGATTQYLAYGRCRHPGLTSGYEPNERLHRECLRCGFEWDEATVTKTRHVSA